MAGAVLAGEVQRARTGENLADRHYDYAQAGPTTAVWVGDSTAFGTGAADGGGAVASSIATARAERVVMLAVPGATAADVVRLQLPRVEAEEPAVVYVSVGANDVTHLTSVGAFRHEYRKLLAGLPAGARVVALGIPDMGAPPRLAQPLRSIAGWRGRRLGREIRPLVERRPHSAYVDIAGATGRTFRREPDRMFAADRYHPSSAGYGLWSRAVLAIVER